MDLVKEVQAAGVVGAGGAGFPTHIKLGATAECFIVNAVECEPLIATDKYLCRQEADKIIKGIQAIGWALGAKRLIIALKESYVAEIACLQKAIKEAKAAIEIVTLPPFYPAGDEQSLVYEVLGRIVPERGLPLDVGVVVDNVGTVVDVWNATQEKPVTHKILSVVGEVDNPTLLQVPLGTPIKDCLTQAKMKSGEMAVLLGGPMMGRILTDSGDIDGAVVTKTLGNLLVLPRNHELVRRGTTSIQGIKRQALSACIQCQMCTDLCPRFLIGHWVKPHEVMRHAFKENSLGDDAFIRAFGSAVNCCDCGICELFACPMGLSPRRMNGYFKEKLRERGLTIEKGRDPRVHPMIAHRRIPTHRLIARINLQAYEGQKPRECGQLLPSLVRIPLKMHIGSPARPIVAVGDVVALGQPIGEAQEGLSVNLHASMAGTVTEVTDYGITIEGKGGTQG